MSKEFIHEDTRRKKKKLAFIFGQLATLEIIFEGNFRRGQRVTFIFLGGYVIK